MIAMPGSAATPVSKAMTIVAQQQLAEGQAEPGKDIADFGGLPANVFSMK